MDEVDTIIIHQLKDIGCYFEDEVSTLKELNVSSIINCVLKCVDLIEKNDKDTFQYESTMNMATKYKVATHLATKCSELGFKGSLGYQTFLYGNESDLRKLILFLLEKLPRDEERIPSAGITTQEALINEIKNSPISTTWLPYMTNDDEKRYWDTKPVGNVLNPKSIIINKIAPSKRKYYDDYACIPYADISSLLEFNSQQLDPHITYILKSKQQAAFKKLTHSQKEYTPEKHLEGSKTDIQANEPTIDAENPNQVDNESRIVKMIEDLEEKLNLFDDELQREKTKEAKIKQKHSHLLKIFEEEKLVLKELEESDKSVEQLLNAVETIKNEIQTLGQRWCNISEDYLNQIKKLKQEHRLKYSRSEEISQELNELKKKLSLKLKEMKQKEITINELQEKLNEPFPPNRASYTKRIMEILNNVKKQNEETKKVLLETRNLQKEINNLSGKVQRAFSVAEDTFFREAKTSEWHKKCYKLLVTMHENFDQLLESLSSIGTIKREIMQLEESVENEKSNKVSANLNRIQADLSQMKTENQQLMSKYHALQREQM